MSEVMIPVKGGGGTSSDELTAKREHVLAGYTAVTKDSDDEAAAGTMPDNSTCTSNGTVPGINSSYPNVPTREASGLQYCEDVDGTARINMCPPHGFYPEGGGSYVNRPAADFGDARASDVSADKTFTSVAGLKKQGELIERGQYQNGGVAFCDTYFAINGLPEGIYRSNGESWAPEARCTAEQLRDVLGIRGDIIKSGNSIAGVAGTLSVQSAISFSAAATSYDTIRISWTNPGKGPWQGVFIQTSTSGIPGTGGGSRAYTGSGNNGSQAGGSNYVDITGLNPGTTYYFTCTSYVDNLGWGTSYNVQATTNIKTASDILNPYIIPNETAIAFDSPNYTSDDKNFKYAGRRITSVSGDDMYTNGTTPITVSTHSKAMGYIEFYGMSSTDAAAIDSIASQLNASYNRLKLYDRSREADAWKIVSTNKGLDVFAVIKFYSNCINESTKKYELYMSIVEMRTSGGTLDRDPCVFPDTGNGFYWMHFFKE